MSTIDNSTSEVNVKRVLTIVSNVLRESADITKESLAELESIEMKYHKEYEEAEEQKEELTFTLALFRYIENDRNWRTNRDGAEERLEALAEFRSRWAIHSNTLEEYYEACRKLKKSSDDLWGCRNSVRDCYKISAAIEVSFPKLED